MQLFKTKTQELVLAELGKCVVSIEQGVVVRQNLFSDRRTGI